MKMTDFPCRRILPALLGAAVIGCGGGGGGGTSVTPPSPPQPPPPAPEMVPVGSASAGYGTVSFFPARIPLAAADRDPCDTLEGPPESPPVDVCDAVQAAAGNFRVMGVDGDSFASLSAGRTSWSHNGTVYVAGAAPAAATVVVFDGGFNPDHPMLADVFLKGYDFFLHSSGLTADSDTEIEKVEQLSRANTDPREGVPFFVLNTVAVSEQQDRQDLRENYFEHLASFNHGSAVAAMVAGRRMSITISTGTYRNRVLLSPPGLAPGTKVLPIQVLGAVSINICKAGPLDSCRQQRPHFVFDNAFPTRLSVIASLAWHHNAFAANGSLGPGGQGILLTLVSRQPHTVTLVPPDGKGLSPIVATIKVTIVDAVPILFAPHAVDPATLAREGDIAGLPQQAQDFITGKNGGDGIAFVFAAGNSGMHDLENSEYYQRRKFKQQRLTMVAGSLEAVDYEATLALAASLTIANDLSQKLPNNVDIRDFGLDATVTIEWTDSDDNDRLSVHVTRAVVGYTGGMYRLPDNEDLKPYWLMVVASRNVTVGDGTVTATIAPYSNGCGVAWDRCLTAPGDVLIPFNHFEDPTIARFTYVNGTSFAAPYVTGALALLKQHFPDLRADAGTAILLETADDLGPEGPDPIYGMGHLNIVRAMQPTGPLTSRASAGVPLAGSYLALSEPLAALAAASGQITGYDRYARPFYMSLASVLRQPGRSRPSPARDRIVERESFTQVSGRHELGYAGGRLEWFAFTPADGLRLSHDLCPRACRHAGEAWGFLPAHLELGSISRLRQNLLADDLLAFEAAAATGRSTQARWRQLALQSTFSPLPGLQLRAEGGLIGESDSLLGSELGGALALPEGARSRFVHVAGRLQLGEDVHGYASYAVSRTRAQVPAAGVLVGISELRAEALRLGVQRSGVLRAGDRMQLEMSQPLRVRSGKLAFFAGGYDEDGRPASGRFEIDLGGRERVWTLSYLAPAAWSGMRGALAAAVQRRRDDAYLSGSPSLSYWLSLSLQM